MNRHTPMNTPTYFSYFQLKKYSTVKPNLIMGEFKVLTTQQFFFWKVGLCLNVFTCFLNVKQKFCSTTIDNYRWVIFMHSINPIKIWHLHSFYLFLNLLSVLINIVRKERVRYDRLFRVRHISCPTLLPPPNGITE